METQFQAGLDDLFQNHFEDIVTFPDPDNYPADFSLIKEVDLEGKIEVGSKQHRIHWHGLLKIVHDTKVQVLQKNIQHWASIVIPEHMPDCKNPYVNSRWVRSEQPILNYIAKSMSQEKEDELSEKLKELRLENSQIEKEVSKTKNSHSESSQKKTTTKKKTPKKKK